MPVLETLPKSSKPPSVQKDFQIGFIRAALLFAIFAGFALGAHVASVIGFNFSLGEAFYAYVQTHGHVQLLGWVGLFVMGISLHFIPRLAGQPLASTTGLKATLWLVSAGLGIRFLAGSVITYVLETPWFALLSWLIAFSGLLACLGIGAYVGTIIQTARQAAGLARRPAFRQVWPFFAMMLLGWLLYATLNLFLTAKMAASGSATVHQAWNELAVQIFLNVVLLPVTFAFSVRMFPLYLRLPAIDWSVKKVALVYALAVAAQLLPTIPPIAALPSRLPLFISCAGLALKGGVILYFIFKLDLLTRRRDPWTVHRKLHPGPERRPTRKGIPDYGEFGHFERLVYSAYIWLIAAALLEIVLGVAYLLQISVPVSSDAVRHLYLLGFITQLILGMAPRMIPGFLKQKQVARPKLVNVTFWLINLALVGRVFPLIIPPAILQAIPGMIVVSQIGFGLSGVLGLAAVVCLAVNLVQTARGS